MRIISVDPGLTIGLAYLNIELNLHQVFQTNDTYIAAEWVEQRYHAGATILVENYQSSGSLTKEASETLRLVGFFYHWAGYMDWHVRLVPPQKRLSGVAEAERMIGKDQLATMHRNGRDAVAALAHAIVHARQAA